jgi:hypothetical protein
MKYNIKQLELLKKRLMEESKGLCQECGQLPDWRGLSMHHKITDYPFTTGRSMI